MDSSAQVALFTAIIMVYLAGVFVSLSIIILLGVLQKLAGSSTGKYVVVWWENDRTIYLFVTLSLLSWLWFIRSSFWVTLKSIFICIKIIFR